MASWRALEKPNCALERRFDAVDDDFLVWKLSWAEWLIDKRVGELL